MSQTLQLQQQIGRYRVLEKLGEGGMGEVYLARDETLERNVALKVLPPDLVGNEQRLRRFVLEAKSASSLNHPNIVTIYEIGSDRVRDADGEPLAAGGSGAPVHYIAMEHVQGGTLGDQIHRDKADLRTLVGYLAQVAEGLAKAHAAGIVHRDLKPGNVMVTPDGFAKVLDFGLAKLTERSSDSEGTTVTAGREALTGQGMVVGTAGYMSPEQVAGRAVDARSDIFSFGCMAYEAATRQRPFVGDTTVDTLHKILNEKPKPVEELNPRVPADLRRVIRRCLAKSPEQRYQSIKDVAIELREIGDQWETLAVAGASASGSGSGAQAAQAAPPRRSRRWLLAGAAAALVIVVTAVVAWFVVPRFRIRPGSSDDTLQSLKIASIISGGEVSFPTLSRDGRHLAYVKTVNGTSSILVRQVATGSDVQVLDAGQLYPHNVSFSPDGEYLYYLSELDRNSPNTTTLLAVPSLGGEARKVVSRVDSGICFSPDGKEIAFFRAASTEEIGLVLFDVESGAERVLTTFRYQGEYPVDRIAWSSDGQRILTAFRGAGPETGDLKVVAFHARTGERQVLGAWNGLTPAGATWLPEDRLIVAGVDPKMNSSAQLWLAQYPRGPRRRITNDQNWYREPSATADGTLLTAHRQTAVTALWSVRASGDGEPQRVQLGIRNPFDPKATLDGSLVFRVAGDEGDSLWLVRPGAGGLRQITPTMTRIQHYGLLRERNTLVFDGIARGSVTHVWRMDTDGGHLTQLTRGSGEALLDVSSDGRDCLFSEDKAGAREFWRVALDGASTPVLVARSQAAGDEATFSPDGRLVAHAALEHRSGRWQVVVSSREGGSPVAVLDQGPQWVGFRWSPDASALSVVVSDGSVDTLMRWPIGGGAPTPLLRFAKGPIQSFRWSQDGRELLFGASQDNVGNLWAWRPGMPAPRQLTRFPSGSVNYYDWSPDAKTVYFNHHEDANDIVLIRGIK